MAPVKMAVISESADGFTIFRTIPQTFCLVVQRQGPAEIRQQMMAMFKNSSMHEVYGISGWSLLVI